MNECVKNGGSINRNEFDEKIGSVDSELQIILKSISQQVLTETDSKVVQVVNLQTVFPILKQLFEMLIDDDSQALSFLEKLKNEFQGSQQDQIMQRIDELTVAFDFEGALKEMATLAQDLGISL